MIVSSFDLDTLLFVFAALFFLFGAWFGRFMTRYPFGRKPFTGMEAMIGMTGLVKKVRDGTLEVAVDGQIWVAESDSISDLNAGDYVRIDSIEGMKLKVSRRNQ